MSQLEQEMSRDELIALRNKRTGVTVFQWSWILVFVCLILVNLQIRGNFATWPPEGVAALDKVFPTIATIGLLISAWLARSGLKAMAAGEREKFFSPWLGALGLAIAFFVVMTVQFFSAQIDNQYGAIFRVMIGYHALHAVVIAYIMLRVYQMARAGGYSPRDYFPVEAGARLWYFVVAAWIMFYVVLYVL
jgi:cytochrome c oxidase subunit 3